MQSDSIKELATALAKVQAALQPAVKGSVNPHFKSKYADLGAIWDACRKPLADNGLSIIQMPTDSGEARIALTTMLLHTSGEYISSTCSTRLQQDSAQGVGSALTYLRRYALAAMVGVVADEDDDGNAASQPQQRQQQPQRPARTEYVPADDERPPANDIQEKRRYVAELRSKAVKARIAYSPPKSPGDMSALELDATINALETALGIKAPA